MKDWFLYFAAVVVATGFALTLLSRYRAFRENRRGWRTSIDSRGIRYEEKAEKGWDSLLIPATLRGHGFGELLIPCETVWDSRYPAWARGRREEIVCRVRQLAPAMPLREEPEE